LPAAGGLGNSPQYYGQDGHGSVRLLLEQDGTILNTYTYDAFGVLIQATPEARFGSAK